LVLAFEVGAATFRFVVVDFFFVVGAFTFFMFAHATFWHIGIARRLLQLRASSMFLNTLAILLSTCGT
jgi:hypothetical protein